MFRFAIRDLLWLIVVVAIAVVWIKDHSQLLSRTEQHVDRLACDSLLGQSTQQIVDVFGNPEGKQGNRWSYWAGTGSEADTVWLELVFDNGYVVRAAHRTY